MKKITTVILSLLFCLRSFIGVSATQTPAPGTYRIPADLSCFIDAMGGREFGEGRIKDAVLQISADAAALLTLTFQRTQVNIYSINCYTGIDATNAHPGYYDAMGQLHKDAAYTLAEDTIPMNLAPAGYMGNDMVTDVHDVSSMTFPIMIGTREICLYLYVNSQVMGVQFCDGSGSYGSANPDKPTPYRAILSLDWSRLEPLTPDAQVQTDKPGSNDELYLPFDVDLDGIVSAADARLVLRASVGLEAIEENTITFFAADSDEDGHITAADARHILRVSVGLEEMQTPRRRSA